MDRLIGRLRTYLVPLAAYLVVLFVMSKVQMAAAHHSQPLTTDPVTFGPSFTDVDGKLAWGTTDYTVIARDGYRAGEGQEAAFPGFALAIRYLSQLTGSSIEQAQLLLGILSGLATTLLFWGWMIARKLARPERLAALAVFLSYPYAFMLYGIPYNDVFLLALVLGVMVLMERDRPVLAGLVGAAASATRPNALALVPMLVAFQLTTSGALLVRSGADPWRDRVSLDWSQLTARRFGVLLSLVGIGSYSAWLTVDGRGPLSFLTGQGAYGHLPLTNPNTLFKIGIVDAHDRLFGQGLVRVSHLLALIVLVGTIALLPAVVRRFGWAYGIFVVCLLITGWVGSIGFAPMGRYLLPALPMVVAVAGSWLSSRRWALLGVVCGFSALSIWFTCLFAQYLWFEW